MKTYIDWASLLFSEIFLIMHGKLLWNVLNQNEIWIVIVWYVKFLILRCYNSNVDLFLILRKNLEIKFSDSKKRKFDI